MGRRKAVFFAATDLALAIGGASALWLGMPEMATGRAPQEKSRETLHSDGPSEHHDSPAQPVYGGKAGPAAPDIRPEGARAPNLGK